jgi:hypothetical protein
MKTKISDDGYLEEVDLGVRIKCPECLSLLVCDKAFVNTDEMIVVVLTCKACGAGKTLHLYINRTGSPLQESLFTEIGSLKSQNGILIKALKEIVYQDSVSIAQAALLNVEKDQ